MSGCGPRPLSRSIHAAFSLLPRLFLPEVPCLLLAPSGLPGDGGSACTSPGGGACGAASIPSRALRVRFPSAVPSATCPSTKRLATLPGMAVGLSARSSSSSMTVFWIS